MAHDKETNSGDNCLIEDYLIDPWTALVMRDAVVAIFPPGAKETWTHAGIWATMMQFPVTIYGIDERLPPPVLGSTVTDPVSMGWVELGKHEPSSASPI